MNKCGTFADAISMKRWIYLCVLTLCQCVALSLVPVLFPLTLPEVSAIRPLCEEDGIRIPASVVVEDGSAAYVFVLDRGRGIRRRVRLGERNGEWIQILAGLSPDEMVLGGAPLENGGFVRIEPEKLTKVIP